MTLPPGLYPHQEQAFSALYKTGCVFFRKNWQQLPVRPRFARFLAGPTGTGKSYIVRALARSFEVPLLEIGASNWMPLGSQSRGANPTWVDIATLIRRKGRGIIFLDELDKIDGRSSWMQHIRVEIFSLLDLRLPDTLSLVPPEEAEALQEPIIRERLRRRLGGGFWIIGAGAFQDFQENSRQQPLGFNVSENVAPSLSQNDMAKVIPREIVNRFSAPVLNLPLLRETDYRLMLEQVQARSPVALQPLIATIGRETLPSAVVSQSGCRWLEEVMLETLIRSLSLPPLGNAAPLDPQT